MFDLSGKLQFSGTKYQKVKNFTFLFLLFTSVSQQYNKPLKKKKKVIALYCLAKHDVQQSSLKYRLNNNENNYIFPFFSLSAKLSIQSITPFCLVSEKTKSKTRKQSYNQIVVLGLVQSKSRITKNSKRFKFIFLYKNFPTNQTDHMKPNNIPFISFNIQQ